MKLYIEGKNIEKYFSYREESNGNVFLSPKTSEIFQYYQYIKNYDVIIALSY